MRRGTIVGILFAVGVVWMASQYSEFEFISESRNKGREALVESALTQDTDADFAALESRIAELERLVASQSAGPSLPPPLEIGVDVSNFGTSYMVTLTPEKHFTLLCTRINEAADGTVFLDCGWSLDFFQHPLR